MTRRSKQRRFPARSALALTVVLATATAGCAFQQKQVEKELANPAPVDCRTAPGDLRVLRQEKAHVVQRIAAGVTAIYPAGLVLGLVTGTEETKLQVAAGQYNEMIDRRIVEIQNACGL